MRISTSVSITLGFLTLASVGRAEIALQESVNIMVRLCVAGGTRLAADADASGDIHVQSFGGLSAGAKLDLKVQKSQVEGLVNGIDNAITQVAADQADKVRTCLQP